MFLAQSVVPSSGSTAMSTLGPVLRPTSSPMNSIGASSRSPSPITTVPWIGSLLSSRRIASTAAWSAAFSLPRPRRRAARSEEHTSELQSRSDLVCRLLLEKKKKKKERPTTAHQINKAPTATQPIPGTHLTPTIMPKPQPVGNTPTRAYETDQQSSTEELCD